MRGRAPRIIAFYLPQFHPIPENDRWWGTGFTDWHNVRKARPLFPGHQQPRSPHPDLGYYDPTDPETLAAQARIARAHGVHGFCFYHYWFNGSLLLERPLQVLLAHPEIDLPFCVSWANEPWTRAWDGKERDVLMPQYYGDQKEWEQHFAYLLPALTDPRAIRVADAPLLLLYRIGAIPRLNDMLARWRLLARDAGLPGLHIVAMLTGFTGSAELRNAAVDAACEFLPTWALRPRTLDWFGPGFGIGLHLRAAKKFTKRLDHLVTRIDYDAIWQRVLHAPQVFPRQYKGAFVSWDNSPRKGTRGMTLVNVTPERYGYWLGQQIQRALAQPDTEPLVFLNAWNEWAEGAYLEPDTASGYAYLEQTQRALSTSAMRP